MDDEVRMIKETAHAFVVRELKPIVEKIDAYPDIPFQEDLIHKTGQLGFLSIALPEPLGGSGKGIREMSIVIETIAEELAGFAALILIHSLAQQIIFMGGDKRGQRRWLSVDPKSGSSPLLCFPAYIHPSDCGNGVIAIPDKTGYQLNGILEFVPVAPVAQGFVIPARKEREGGELLLFILPKKLKGLKINEPLIPLGLRACPVADVEFHSCHTPRNTIIAGGKEAEDLLCREINRFFGPVMAISAGILAGSVDTALKYARERYQGGKQIIDHPQIRMMLAKMVVEKEVALLCMERLCQLEDQEVSLDMGQSKALLVQGADGAVRATTDGVQILGGYGYMEDYGQERRMRDAKQAQGLLGRNDLIRLELIREMIER